MTGAMHSSLAAGELPVVGLIVPPLHGDVPPDGVALYGTDRVRFIARGAHRPGSGT